MHLSEKLMSGKEIATAKIFDEGATKVLSMRLAKDALLKEHTSKTAAFLLCVEGSVVYHEEPRGAVELSSGDFINIVPDLKHSVTAKTDSLLVLVKS